MSSGAVYIVYGQAAQREAGESAETLRAQAIGLPIVTVGEGDIPVPGQDGVSASRWCKVNLDHLSPFEDTLYIDADTRVTGDVLRGFTLLEQGWELVIGVSRDDWLGHVAAEEREATEAMLGWRPLGLQAGLFWFRKCPAIHRLFTAWREEWGRYRDMDQAALLRALQRNPVKIALIDQASIIDHRFGALQA